MKSPCPSEFLEALLEGTLETRQAERLHLHVAACASCTTELGWLRQEHALFAARSRGSSTSAIPPGHLAAIVAKAEARRPRVQEWRLRHHWGELAGAALCAATVVAMTVGARPVDGSVEASAGICRSELGPELESNADNARVCVSEPRSLSYWASLAPVPVSRSPR